MSKSYYLKWRDPSGKAFYLFRSGIWVSELFNATQFPTYGDAEDALRDSIFSAEAEILEYNADEQKD